ncbi:MAG: ABC transporter ATP-binding protein [Magnetococcus sp. WYHC-3]
MAETMIALSGVSRDYGSILALRDIDLTVERGEVVGFLGPNGAGKTTAMRILAGLLAPSRGTVHVAGIDMLADAKKAKARLGFLPETPPLYDDMTVREYLTYLAALRGVERRDLGRATGVAMERCGLAGVADRLLRNLSKGYRQRAGIAQAIVHAPAVVVLDEPTVGLDPIQIREIRRLIGELGGDHSVLLSTHILPEVRMTCHRVAVINQGRIVATDTIEGLEHRARGGGRIRVRWQSPPEDAALLALGGIVDVSHQPDGQVVITPQPGADPVPDLVRESVARGWDLRELAPQVESLEDIFVQLTTRESDEGAAP